MKNVLRFLGISAMILAVALLLIPQASSNVLAADDKKEDESNNDTEIVEPKEAIVDTENATGEGEKDESESDKNVLLEDNSVWTMYAQFIMTTKADEKKKKKDKEEQKGYLEKKVHKAYDGAISGIIGKGAVTLDLPYNKMYKLANDIRGQKEPDEKDSAGTQMASFLSTYSHYGYIDTMSGQTAVANTKDAGGGVGRAIFGGFISFALVIYSAINTALQWLIEALISANPLALMGFGDSTIVDDNPISKALHNFFKNIGLDSKFWDTLADFGLTAVTLVFLISVMWFLMKGQRSEALRSVKEWAVRVFGIVAAATLVLFFSSAMAKQVKSIYEDTNIDDNLVMKHLFNTRGWAASSNLSPNGLQGNEFPNAKADSGHIDKDFDPLRSRDLISNINETTYNTLYGMDGESSGFDLLNRWMSNENFNVNTYIGDIRRGNLKNGDSQLPAFDNYKEDFGGKNVENWDNGNIEYSMWSATQNYDDELRKVDSKYFKPESTTGVRQQDSFSTQSVVLMLQSSFDSKGASFYAYNLGPTGLQADLKNVSTVKTEWKEVTLPGDGGIGVAGSYISLGAHALVVIIIGLGVFLALLTLNFFEAFKRIGMNLVKMEAYGDPFAFLSLLIISLMFVVSLLIAGMATGVFIALANELAAIVDKMTLGHIPSGFIDITKSLAMIFFAYIFALRKPTKGAYPPLKSFVGFPLTGIAFKYDDKVKQMSGNMKNRGKAGFRAVADTARESVEGTKDLGQETGRATSSFAAGTAGGYLGARYGKSRRRGKGGHLGKHGIASAKETAINAHKGNRAASENAYNNGGRKAFKDLNAERQAGKQDKLRRDELKELGYTDEEIEQVMAAENGNNTTNPEEKSVAPSKERNQSIAHKPNMNDNKDFKSNDLNSPNSTDSSEDYRSRLGESAKDDSKAFLTDSAVEALGGTEFVNESGVVDIAAIKQAQEEIARTSPENRSEELQNKADVLQKAHNRGTEELAGNSNKGSGASPSSVVGEEGRSTGFNPNGKDDTVSKSSQRKTSANTEVETSETKTEGSGKQIDSSNNAVGSVPRRNSRNGSTSNANNAAGSVPRRNSRNGSTSNANNKTNAVEKRKPAASKKAVKQRQQAKQINQATNKQPTKNNSTTQSKSTYNDKLKKSKGKTNSQPKQQSSKQTVEKKQPTRKKSSSKQTVQKKQPTRKKATNTQGRKNSTKKQNTKKVERRTRTSQNETNEYSYNEVLRKNRKR
ncbi:hypothetical protein [Staphylococcus sp. GDY8P168P-1]|uniref:hypothetical protein n=1 Tax=Staphylococcus sp. GDY8P168P-1 TaxID=2804167 RepID=UPI001AEC1464|nr:hypothetical protein [Staphylococcus sp. GDY8P168P-1]